MACHLTALVVVCVQVVDIMRVNVEKVLERDKKLTELDDRAGYTFVDICENITVVFLVTVIFTVMIFELCELYFWPELGQNFVVNGMKFQKVEEVNN